MKPIKIFGFAVLAALMTMALTGASSASAESTALCSTDSLPCVAVAHTHEVSVGKGVLLSSLVTIECEVLFLGDVSSSGAPLKIKGNFTYPMTGCETTSGTLCEVAETSKEATIEVLKTAHELAEVKGSAEVNAHCGALINCTYNGVGLLGHGLGPLLSTSENGNVNISEQTTNKTGGAFCPKTAKLDLTTTPLQAAFIVAGLHYCVDYEVHQNDGYYADSHCTERGFEPTERYELVVESRVFLTVGEVLCVDLGEEVAEQTGLWEARVNGICKNDNEENLNESRYEKGRITLVK